MGAIGSTGNNSEKYERGEHISIVGSTVAINGSKGEVQLPHM